MFSDGNHLRIRNLSKNNIWWIEKKHYERDSHQNSKHMPQNLIKYVLLEGTQEMLKMVSIANTTSGES